MLDTGNWQPGTEYCYSLKMQHWIARLLVLVMVVPAFGSVTMASAAQPAASHCMRPAGKPLMHCHGMEMASDPASSEANSPEASFRAANSCCADHDCCRGMAAPTLAQAQLGLFFQPELPAAKAPRIPRAQITASDFAYGDSARAPPRS